MLERNEKKNCKWTLQNRTGVCVIKGSNHTHNFYPIECSKLLPLFTLLQKEVSLLLFIFVSLFLFKKLDFSKHIFLKGKKKKQKRHIFCSKK